MSAHSRRKGTRVELAMAKLIGARKISRAYQAGHDLELEVGDRVLKIECKARNGGFGTLYAFLGECDALIIKSDRREPLCICRLSLANEIVNGKHQR